MALSILIFKNTEYPDIMPDNFINYSISKGRLYNFSPSLTRNADFSDIRKKRECVGIKKYGFNNLI
jgi:hypothetical protein